MAKQCAGCLQEISDRRYLTCALCHQCYDLDCANVPECRFNNTMTIEHKNLWRCQLCRSKEPKVGNSNTPIHPKQRNEETLQRENPPNTYPEIPNTPTNQKINPNITIRKKISRYTSDSSELEDITIRSPQGNTLLPESFQTQTDAPGTSYCVIDDETISLQKFTYILKQNNKYLMSELNASFQKQIESAICELKSDFQQNLEKISMTQTQTKEKLRLVDSKIALLEQKCYILQAENNKLQQDFEKIIKYSPNPITDNSEKVLVLHGLPENYWETENQLTDRIINIFMDILNIDLTGYIEEITYIGRKSRMRPIKIELISKRMKKNILNNYGYFKGTGLSVTEFLSSSALREQKELKRALYTARQNGHHAIIRNNVLIINGKEVTPTESAKHHTYSSPGQTERKEMDIVKHSSKVLEQTTLSSPLPNKYHNMTKKKETTNQSDKEQEKASIHTFRN